MVREGTSSWEYLVPSTVRLGLALLSCVPLSHPFAAAAAANAGDAAARSTSCAPLDDETGLQVRVALSMCLFFYPNLPTPAITQNLTLQAHPMRRAAALGLSLLCELFAAHKTSRKFVIEAIQGHVVTTKGEQCAHYLRLLTRLCRDDPAALVEFTPQLKEALEYITFLRCARIRRPVLAGRRLES